MWQRAHLFAARCRNINATGIYSWIWTKVATNVPGMHKPSIFKVVFASLSLFFAPFSIIKIGPTYSDKLLNSKWSCDMQVFRKQRSNGHVNRKHSILFRRKGISLLMYSQKLGQKSNASLELSINADRFRSFPAPFLFWFDPSFFADFGGELFVGEPCASKNRAAFSSELSS